MLCLIELVQTYGSEWSVGYLRRWTDLLERLVLIVIALMLVRVVVIVASFFHRYRLAQIARMIETDSGAQRKMAAELSVKLGSLQSIFSTAPYFGLLGSCIGILSTFRGYEGTRFGFVVMVVSGIEAALLSTAAGILVAVPATCFYNYLRTRMDSLDSEMSNGLLEKRRFPLPARFSAFPFSVITASALAIFLATFMIFPSFHVPKGLAVRLLKIGVPETEHLVEPIVITVGASKTSDSPVVYVNSKKKPWGELEKELRTELQLLPPRSLAYVQAENSVSWRDVLNVIDTAEGLHADVLLLTTTPDVSPKFTR